MLLFVITVEEGGEMSLFDVLKTAAAAFKEAGKIDLYTQILDVQAKLLEMQNVIRTQSDEIRDLREKLRIKGDIFFDNNACWLKRSGEENDGPFCSGCWGQSQMLINLHNFPTTERWICPVCKNSVWILEKRAKE